MAGLSLLTRSHSPLLRIAQILFTLNQLCRTKNWHASGGANKLLQRRARGTLESVSAQKSFPLSQADKTHRSSNNSLPENSKLPVHCRNSFKRQQSKQEISAFYYAKAPCFTKAFCLYSKNDAMGFCLQERERELPSLNITKLVSQHRTCCHEVFRTHFLT